MMMKSFWLLALVSENHPLFDGTGRSTRWLNGAVHVFIFLHLMGAGEAQRGRTKTSRTGSGCPPCTCHAPSSTCCLSCLQGRTCNPLDEVRIRSRGRSPPEIGTFFGFNLKLGLCREKGENVDNLRFICTGVKVLKDLFQRWLQELYTCLPVEPACSRKFTSSVHFLIHP